MPLTPKKILEWLVAIACVCVAAVLIYALVSDFFVNHGFPRLNSLLGIHSSVLNAILLATVAAVIATVVVVLFRATKGPLEFSALGIKFQGPSGPILLWTVAFLAIAVALRLFAGLLPDHRDTPTSSTSAPVASDIEPERKREEPASTPSSLSVKCSSPKDFSACAIECSAFNPHGVGVSNVSVGFNGIYPYQTRLAAGPETHMDIKKQETLPLPMTNGHIDQGLQAFSVEIPLIPPKTSLSFRLWSLSDDNQKTCTYLKTTIRAEQRKKIDQLVRMDSNLDADRIESLQMKKESLYIPGYFMSSEGRWNVEFVTIQEERNAKKFSVLYERVGKSILGRTCLAPVFAAERTDGNVQYFTNAPPMMTWTLKLKQTPHGFETDSNPPESYFCVDK